MDKNPPAARLTDGNIKATVFENKNTENQSYFTTKISKSYCDSNGNWRESTSFGQSDLLRVARLSTKAYDRVDELKRSNIQSTEQSLSSRENTPQQKQSPGKSRGR